MNADIPAAAQAYARCTNPRLKDNCRARAATNAPRLATAAAFNGKCDQARVIIAAALAMNVPEGRLAKAREACK